MLLKAQVEEGYEITNTIAEAIALCRIINKLPFRGTSDNMGLTEPFYDLEVIPDESDQCTVRFTFSDVTVSVRADSDPALILRDWNRAISGYIPKTVEPYPKPELSEAELANDARTETENEKKNNQRLAVERERYEAKRREHRKRVMARMANAPAMEFSDGNAWLEAVAASAGNPTSDGILAYTERWARLMQLELAEGKTLEEVWNSTSHEADLGGMSGASQPMATHLLTLCWVHGAELRRLHNAFWGSDATDRTVNPFVIRIDDE